MIYSKLDDVGYHVPSGGPIDWMEPGWTLKKVGLQGYKPTQKLICMTG
jgi:hypothetical protein